MGSEGGGISMTDRVTVPADVLMREIGGEAVILNLDSEQYYGLDEVGTRMWTLLSESDSIGAAYEALLAEFEVAPEVLQADLERLVRELAEQGLLRVEAAGSEVPGR